MTLKINGTDKVAINLWYGEIKKFTYTYNVSIEGSTFELRIRDNDSKLTVMTILDTEFDKTDISDKKVSYTLDTTDLTVNNTYEFNIITSFPDNTKDISDVLYIKLNQ